MEYVELPPPPPLDRLVHRFWFLRGAPDRPDAVETIVPDGRPEIVLHLGEPFAQADGRTRRVQAPVLAAGQLTGPLRLHPRDGADVVGIRLRPGGAAALLGLPQQELTGRVVPLAEVAPRLASALLDAVARVSGRRARAAALVHALARGVIREPGGPVAAAVARLEADPALPIGRLASTLGLTPRTLQRRFLDEVGVGPRMLRRILRFRVAFGLLDRSPPGRWAAAPARAGYFDQAHLIREFRRFAGAAPTAFFRTAPDLARAFGEDDARAER